MLKKYVIYVRDHHISIIWIEVKKWKSEYPADAKLIQLIMVMTRGIRSVLHNSSHLEVMSFELDTTERGIK